MIVGSEDAIVTDIEGRRATSRRSVFGGFMLSDTAVCALTVELIGMNRTSAEIDRAELFLRCSTKSADKGRQSL